MPHHVFGIRHHGPGSARSLVQALEALQPDCILVEGPPEADGILSLTLHEQMKPPVALLAYAPDEPQRAVYYPFVAFSPEWQAIRYALLNKIPVQFMDLPVGMSFAREKGLEEAAQKAAEEALAALDEGGSECEVGVGNDVETGANQSSEQVALDTDTSEVVTVALADADQVDAAEKAGVDADSDLADDSDVEQAFDQTANIRRDPLALLAEAAGYSDSERWWEHMIEERQDSSELFEAIAEAMTALRAEVDATSPRDTADHEREQLREAHMRKTLRKANKDGYENIAVVCGAWHVPALQTLPTAKSDNDLLKGLPKLKTATTWVPWTHSRLSSASGYGAGVTSPGWYAHIWQQSDSVAAKVIAQTISDDSATSTSEQASAVDSEATTNLTDVIVASSSKSTPKQSISLTTHWLTQVAHTFRDQGLDISSAHVIEAVRLAEALAAMRGRPQAGLAEMNEAVRSVMLFGDDMPMRLLHEKLIIGEVLGAVPDETPQTPLQQDLSKHQRRLRLKPEASDKEIILDLRKPNDLEKSCLLRRLGILGIEWGEGGRRASGKGTFKESWRLRWQPEFEIQLIEAGLWGNTLEQAATAKLIQTANDTRSLATLAEMAHSSLYADLPAAVDHLMRRLQDEAAVNSDIAELMQALPELARLLRYGDVRQTSVKQVASVVNGMVTRICIGLPNACHSLNEDAAEAMFLQIQGVQEAVGLLDDEDYTEQWMQALVYLSDQPELQGLLAGRCCRLLLQAGRLDEDESARRFGLALSAANDPAQAASWVDGFLRGSGQLLIYDEALWALIDSWVSQLSADTFQQLLPVLRRTFSTFEAPERRQMGERVKNGAAALPAVAAVSDLDEQRAALALPLLAQILGLEVSDV